MGAKIPEYDAWRLKRMNSVPGKLTGMDCPKCLNRGFYYVWDEAAQDLAYHVCECKAQRDAAKRLHSSGISQTMERLTFDSYQASEPWQIKAKTGAMAYAAHPAGWLYMGGQVGSGKTHLCTAALRELAKQYPVVYMLWRDECARIKAQLNEPEGVAAMNRLKSAKVLYIDDLFKGTPTQGDLNLAFELLNARYNREDLYTIISSERMIPELVEIDEGIGSRIAEKSKGHRLEIKRDTARNWRCK